MRRGYLYTLLSFTILTLASCSATKFVPDGYYLLDEVKVCSSALRALICATPSLK